MKTDTQLKIAFLGLGVMGSPMAKNLIRSQFQLAVYDINPQAMADFRQLECRCAQSPADAATDADITIVILPDSSYVREALLGQDGAASVMKPNSLVVDMSTGSSRELLQLNMQLRQMGLRLIDAPVGRSRREAVTGNLIVIAGGDDDDIREAGPVFNAMADTVLHMGAVGMGLKAKLVNNYGSMVNMVIAAELLTFAAKLGLDQSRMLALFRETPAGKGQLTTNYPKKVLAGDVSPDFPLFMGLKDLGLALDLAAENGMPVWLGAAAEQLYGLSRSYGRENEDCTAMLLLLEEIAGIRRTATG
ncbi:NAD(P)-dependent oxidoreductase [Aliamphritea hakodatensis]|uniref:NAD(P)-dependent oxidoreductase n=1 Tax=Aliamphritea hakodatensis TaxID=2895352 RepID=UPI0022FD87CF|nr:NAD(P)-binding domain-containing protein [Aliamphritea hakodatensis]